MSDSIVIPAFQQVTPNNHGPWVVVTAYIFLPLSILVVVIRLVTRFQLARSINLNDGVIVISMFLAFVQTICLTIACNHGLGLHRNALSDSSYDIYSKCFYASELLLIASLAFAKASVTLLILAIKPQKSVLIGCYILLGVIALWAISAIFALAFQCDSPRPWDSEPGRCINQHALLIFIGIINIFTDLAVIALSFFLMRNVQVSSIKRWQVVGLFGTRIIVPVITILSLTSLTPYFSSSPPDRPWHAVAPAVYTQIMLNLSIITACIPSLKRFLQDLQSGAMAVNINESFEMGVTKKLSSSQGPYATGSAIGFASKIASKLGVKSQIRSNNMSSAGRGTDDLEDLKHGFRSSDRNGFSQGHNDNPNVHSTNKSTVERSESVKGLTDGVIYKTTDFKVEYEGRSSGGSESRPSGNEDGDRISEYEVRK